MKKLDAHVLRLARDLIISSERLPKIIPDPIRAIRNSMATSDLGRSSRAGSTDKILVNSFFSPGMSC